MEGAPADRGRYSLPTLDFEAESSTQLAGLTQGASHSGPTPRVPSAASLCPPQALSTSLAPSNMPDKMLVNGTGHSCRHYCTVSAFRGYTAQEWGHRELTTALNALLSVPPTWPRTCGGSGKDPYEPGRRGGCLPSWLCGNRGGKKISGAGPVFKLPILCSFWIFAPISKKHGFKTLFEIFWHPL